MKSRTKKGSITVEAAIVLPLFLIAILTIGSLIHLAAAKEAVISAVSDEARTISAYAYTVKNPPAIRSRLKKRISCEGFYVDSFRVRNVQYLVRGGEISFTCSYTVKNRLAIQMQDDFSQSCSFLFRGFVGKDNSGELFTFDEMERADDSTEVWIFPDYGERYHAEACPYIKVKAHQMVLTDQLRKQYSPCRFCKPQELGNGQLVYCFLSSGKAYHTGGCSMVDRYVVSTTKGEAERKGYLPCTKCGGY